jgi:hypothetical protein
VVLVHQPPSRSRRFTGATGNWTRLRLVDEPKGGYVAPATRSPCMNERAPDEALAEVGRVLLRIAVGRVTRVNYLAEQEPA